MKKIPLKILLNIVCMNISFVLENIKKRRKALGLTQKDVALRLFMDERTYSKIERGCKKSIDLTLIFNLAEILEIDVIDILKVANDDAAIAIIKESNALDNIVEMLSQVSQQQQLLVAELEIIKGRIKES